MTTRRWPSMGAMRWRAVVGGAGCGGDGGSWRLGGNSGESDGAATLRDTERTADRFVFNLKYEQLGQELYFRMLHGALSSMIHAPVTRNVQERALKNMWNYLHKYRNLKYLRQFCTQLSGPLIRAGLHGQHKKLQEFQESLGND